MTLFGSSHSPPPPPRATTSTTSGGLFKRNSVSKHSPPVAAENEKHGLFGGRKSSVDLDKSTTSPTSTKSHALFGKKDTLQGAHSKLRLAKQAESAADAALTKAREAVADARREIAHLEKEAKQEELQAKEKRNIVSLLVSMQHGSGHTSTDWSISVISIVSEQASKFRKEGDKLGRFS
ncbi:hypothetical protein JCM10212_002042 [Sporobolomyces blumeae]